MTTVISDIGKLVAKYSRKKKHPFNSDFAHDMASCLRWQEGLAHLESSSVTGIQAEISRAFFADQPAIIFVGHNQPHNSEVLNDAALYAYHASVEWGIVTNAVETTIFNSHWARRNYWFHLPSLNLNSLSHSVDLINAITPQGLTKGLIEQVATQSYEPDRILIPVDDALVNRLDWWRDESLRYAKASSDMDEHLQTLFAQLFVLRAVEDRKLAPQLPRLEGALMRGGEFNIDRVRAIFDEAKSHIQSELFNENVLDAIPPFVLEGIVHDLYTPTGLPTTDARYNFSWIDADVLGRAYQKYLSTLLVPVDGVPSQLALWDQPLREVERISVQKKAGVYYTPAYLVRYLTERAIDAFEDNASATELPVIADISCGSGSFLTAAVDAIIRRLQVTQPDHNWGRELIEKKRIIGLDVDVRAVTLARLSLWLRLAEEPDPLPLPHLNEVIIHGDSLKEETWSVLPQQYDIILGNPPFIPTGSIQSRSELVKHFRTAKGRFDYSYLFVELALKKLAPKGILGLVVPNRLFKNRDADTLREIVTTEADLISIVDFGSTKVFSGVSAYVGTLLIRKRVNQNTISSEATLDDNLTEQVRFIRVHSIPPRFAGVSLSIADREKEFITDEYLSAFYASARPGPNPWLFLSPAAKKARLRIQEESERLAGIALVKQGIKTGANDIFIVRIASQGKGNLAEIINGLGESFIIETDLLRPAMYGSNMQRYDLLRSPQEFIIYPVRSSGIILEGELRQSFPQTYRYLISYRTLLASRSRISPTGKSWYELSEKRAEGWLNSPKILIRDLAQEPAFALDDEGNFYLVGGTAVIPNDSDLLIPLLAYLNSALVKWYLSFSASAFRGNFFKFEPQHISEIAVPLSIINEPNVRDRLEVLGYDVIQAKLSNASDKQLETEAGIDRMLCDLVGIELHEIQ